MKVYTHPSKVNKASLIDSKSATTADNSIPDLFRTESEQEMIANLKAVLNNADNASFKVSSNNGNITYYWKTSEVPEGENKIVYGIGSSSNLYLLEK